MAQRTLVSGIALKTPVGRTVYLTVLAVTTIVVAAVFLYPVYWMATAGLKTPAEFAAQSVTVVPEHPSLAAYRDAWDHLRIPHFFLNTVYYALGGWLVQLAVDVSAAYSLSRLRPVLGKLVFALMLATLMLPVAALLVPAYLTVTDLPILHLNLLNSPWGLWLPAAANGFNIYVLKRFFDNIPNDILEAAAIDGATRGTTLTRIVLPLSRPVLAVISIFSIIGMWKDFLWPMLIMQDPERQTLSVALQRLSASSQVPPTEMIAGMTLAALPMIVIFVIFQRHILGGLSAGAVKG
ncbi:carbohydrate ABC transporter permease [Actinoplanes sp. L3-i22]|uniref:carbohydrate ABC transporter permease n=1 Tax=Actinoplanes sp. L3-i22 TaxID=2836373 RepID=UPI001C75FD61|nr:carbohydrate ABC transporter permease [Actinoplanes sp. L3-i22]BCY08434.1 sugar ABC transporter permease [Actinoplanes sp. L3-i22]